MISNQEALDWMKTTKFFFTRTSGWDKNDEEKFQTICAALSRAAPVDVEILTDEVVKEIDDCISKKHPAKDYVRMLVGEAIGVLNERGYFNPAQGVVDGYKLVPVEPTVAMNAAGNEVPCGIGGSPASVNSIYRAMLNASPQPKDAVSQWQPIDTAPKDKAVLGCMPGPQIDIIFWSERLQSWIDYHYKQRVNPYFGWQALPAPPVEEEKS